jgi:ATP-binding cassette, subfamily B (MDR/TAP), member 1
MLKRTGSFFDSEENSVGALTSRLASDPFQLQQLLGMNTASVLISFFNVVGCIIISFAFGWKLTVVALLTTMPVIVIAMCYRVRYEIELEEVSNAVFAESAKFASESISAIRTVSSLTMEDTIYHRYKALLVNHIRDSLHRSRISLFLFSLSDSISLLCMAFVLW